MGLERERECSRERQNPMPTSEEQDALLGSRKKICDETVVFSSTQVLAPREEEWMRPDETKASHKEGLEEGKDGESSAQRWKSFKEVVSKGRVDDEELEEDWWSGERWKERITVQMTELGPNVIIPQKEKDRLAAKWNKSLIVKLLGRMVDPRYLEMKVQQLWARQGNVEVIDVGMGFFVIQFTDASDYDMALTGGPWLIFDHYLAVQPWKQDFSPKEEKITKVAAWIRLDELALDYYDRGVLYVLGSQIGRVLKVDLNTLKRKKGRFARICVELDLSSPLRPFIFINGKLQRVQYEGIHLICLKCGRYGHDVDHCSYVVSKDQQKPSEGGDVNPGSEGRASSMDTEEKSVNGVQGDGSDLYDWMVVQRPRRLRRSENLGGKVRDNLHDKRGLYRIGERGSRFGALNDEDIMGINHGETSPDPKLVPKNVAIMEDKKRDHVKEKGGGREVRNEQGSGPKLGKMDAGPSGGLKNKLKGEAKSKVGPKVSSNMDHLLKVKKNMGMDQSSSKTMGSDGNKSTTVQQGKLHISNPRESVNGEENIIKSSMVGGDMMDMEAASNPMDPGDKLNRNFSSISNPLSVEGGVDLSIMDKDA